MRIAYVARWDISHESGILKKIVAQIQSWVVAGHEVHLFAFSPGSSVWTGMQGIPLTAFHQDNLSSRLLSRAAVQRPVLEWRPDVIYLRWSTYYPAWEALVNRVATVVELNGDDVTENRLSLPYPLYAVHRLTRGRLLQRARGFVSVTRELAESPRYAVYEKPTVVIGNGVEIARYRVLPAPANPKPRLVFLGYSDCAWHGLDKLRTLALSNPDWHIDVVGSPADGDKGHSAPNLHFHGHLARTEYEPLLLLADAALSTLALHRKGMDEASPLKTREYLAYGLPTIIGYDDTDFPNGHPLMLRLPNTPNNVASRIDEIRAFVEKARGKRVERNSIQHLDVAEKEHARLGFLASMVAGAAG